jgi:hypothetical protein
MATRIEEASAVRIAALTTVNKASECTHLHVSISNFLLYFLLCVTLSDLVVGDVR